MGLALCLLPIECDNSDWGFSHSIIRCVSQRDLFMLIGDIEKEESTLVPKNFTSFLSKDKDGEHCYGQTHDTPYGCPLKAVRVEQLLRVSVQARQYNAAAWAYLAALPPTMRVALYWS